MSLLLIYWIYSKHPDIDDINKDIYFNILEFSLQDKLDTVFK